MGTSQTNLTSRWSPPWGDDHNAFFQAVAGQFSFDGLLVGALHLPKPQPDELLACRGIPMPDLARWFDGGFEQDKLLRNAMRTGLAVSTATPGQEPDSVLTGHHHAMTHMLLESIPFRCWWWMTVIRRSPQPFSEAEQRVAALMLRHWQASYCHPDEPGLGRIVIGHDDRPILMDLETQAQGLRDEGMLAQLLQRMHPVIQQRYPELADRVTRDISVQLGDQLFWVCFRRDKAVDLPRAEHWYIELRPLEDNELPAVGVVANERIAQAIAYLHENFHHSPSLADVARAVHISPFHFHRLFSRQVGLSPKHYLQHKQLQIAKWLLRSGNTPIGDIAHRAGFSSHGHFTSTFHRLVGQSPSEYRETH